MFLSKRSNGLYYIFYNQQNGKRTCKSTKCRNKSDALIFFRNFSIEQVQPAQLPLVEITLKNFSQKHIEYSEIYHTPKTTLTYKTTFNKMLEFFGNINLSEFNKKQIEDFITHRIKTGSVYCGRKDIVNIKASFKWAVNQNYLKSNPADNIKKKRAPEILPKYFSKAEYDKLLSIISCPVIKDIVQIALNTGLRQAEILDLRYSQIDIDRRIIILNNQNHITKSKKIRLVPLNKAAKEVLKKRLRNIVDDYVFKINNKKVNQDYLIHKFKKFVLAANVNPDLSFHSLRHTFASWLVQRGVSIYEISKLLGHSDIKTTQIYSHLSNNSLEDAVNKI